MLSLIIQEHNEGRERVQKMLEQASMLPMEKEVIYVTSMHYQDFYSKYGPFKYKFGVTVLGNVQSCGAARNAGGQYSSGDTLLYLDSHVCFSPANVDRLLTTLDAHPNAIVAPAVQAIDFPSCRTEGGAVGHGVAFRFADRPFEWVWLPSERQDKEFEVPFVCGCAFAMKKRLFSVLAGVGGFLGAHTGLSWEEEKSMRLWRLGHPTYSEPRAVFGHYYKGYPGHTSWDSHSTAGFYLSRVIGAYINIFDAGLWDHIERMCKQAWGDEWTKSLAYAQQNYSWLRNLMKPHAGKIDERWFLRLQ